MEQSLDIKITPFNLIKFALPTVIAQEFMGIYSMVDGIFVSNVIGTDALSAVNIVMPYVMIVLAFGVMIGTGGNAIISAQLGKGKKKEAVENFTLLCIVCLVGCGIISGLSIIFCEPLLNILGTSELLMDHCMNYALPLFCVAPLALLGMALQSFFIANGTPGLGMGFSVAGGVVNIFLDWLLIAKLGMGTRGAAFATGIGYSIPAVLGIAYFFVSKKGNLHFNLPKWRGRVVLKTLTNGSSEMVAMMSSGITTVLMNNVVMRIAGEDGVAAISILIYAMSLLTSGYMGYAMGVAPITSYNYGAGNTDKLKKGNKCNFTLITISQVVMYLLGLLFHGRIISIYASTGTDVYAIAENGYYIFSLAFLLMGFNMYSSSLFTALGDGRTSALISFFRGLIFLGIFIYVLSTIFGLNGLFAAMPAAELVGVGLSLYFVLKKGRQYGVV